MLRPVLDHAQHSCSQVELLMHREDTIHALALRLAPSFFLWFQNWNFSLVLLLGIEYKFQPLVCRNLRVEVTPQLCWDAFCALLSWHSSGTVSTTLHMVQNDWSQYAAEFHRERAETFRFKFLKNIVFTSILDSAVAVIFLFLSSWCTAVLSTLVSEQCW